MTKRILSIFLVVALAVAMMLVMASCGNDVEPVDEASITYDGETIKWGSVENAVKYKITINGVQYTTASTSYPYRSSGGNVEFSVLPVNSDGDEADSVSKTFTMLGQVQNIQFDETGRMYWDSVDGANAYLVEVNGKSSGNIYECSYSNFQAGKINKIRVKI